jgi:y4mF family transcriptional regulator
MTPNDYTKQHRTMDMQIRTVSDVAAVVRSRRIARGMSQASLAAAAGVSRKWIIDMEAGKPAIEMHLLLRALDALDAALVDEDLAPDASVESLDEILGGYHG